MVADHLSKIALWCFVCNQACTVNFLCPMRFDFYPLDSHICKFRVGSVNYDDTRMTLSNYVLDYKPGEGTTILDYQVHACTHYDACGTTLTL